MDTSSPGQSPRTDQTAARQGQAIPRRSGFARVFLGPSGIRAGWRLLIFCLIFVALAAALNFTLHRIPPLEAWQRAQPTGVATAGGALLQGCFAVFVLMVSALIMSKIEKRNFADYGLPLKGAFGKRFWQGVPLGLVMLSILLTLIGALHGFSLGGLALGGADAAKFGVLYGIAFILVAIFEEFSFRGYLQATLGSGIGFWPAAIVLAIVFAAVHLTNSGEAILGALSAGGFGLVAAFSLRRTGTLWFAIGLHAAWDWGETYLYSVPDSGGVAQGHLLNSSFHGATWLTGGSVGPEGSVLVFVALLLMAAAIHILFPAKQSER